jgi:hypothetical protein
MQKGVTSTTALLRMGPLGRILVTKHAFRFKHSFVGGEIIFVEIS